MYRIKKNFTYIDISLDPLSRMLLSCRKRMHVHVLIFLCVWGGVIFGFLFQVFRLQSYIIDCINNRQFLSSFILWGSSVRSIVCRGKWKALLTNRKDTCQLVGQNLIKESRFGRHLESSNLYALLWSHIKTWTKTIKSGFYADGVRLTSSLPFWASLHILLHFRPIIFPQVV